MSEIIIADIDLDEKDLELMLAKQTIREKDAQLKVAIRCLKLIAIANNPEGRMANEALKQIGDE